MEEFVEVWGPFKLTLTGKQCSDGANGLTTKGLFKLKLAQLAAGP